MVKRLGIVAFSVIALCVALLAMPTIASAQAGSSVDILTGVVTGPDGKPLAHVEVSATSAQTGITRKKETGSDGRYTMLFPDGGGQYRIECRAIGLQPVTRNIARQSDEDRLVTDVQLGVATSTELSAVKVAGRSTGGRNRGERPTPGEQGRQLSGDQLSRLPIDPSDLAAVAALAPGVVPISGTDSTAAAFSVAGQRSTLNSQTLDGLSVGNFTVPQEGIRSVRVITNTFDPARGQFTGGQVSTTTRSGTNDLEGGFTYSRKDPSLQFVGSDSSAFSPTTLQDQISAGLGGPIIKDKLFVFGSMQYRRQSNPFQSILAASPATLLASGIQPDSVSRFLNTVNGYNVPFDVAGVPDRRINENTTGVIRFDYFVNDANTLTVRGDIHRQTQDPTRNNLFSLPTNTGSSIADGSGIALTLTSYFESGIINEFSSYYTRNTSLLDGYLALPAGRVMVTSQLSDSTQGVSYLGFGGNPSFPSSSSNTLLEVTNEVSYLSKNRAHRVRLGGLLDVTHFDQDVTTNRLGTFTFNSLEDFVDNTPESYTRASGDLQRLGGTTSGAIYLADTWNPGPGKQIVYGLRAEGTHVGYAPPLNGDVEQAFGVKTNDFPSEIHLSPRVGFSLNLTKPDPSDPFAQFLPAFIVRGGVGEFRANAPTGLYTSAQSANGLPGTEQQLTCIGSAVPTPDWTAYMADPNSAPTECLEDMSQPPAYSSSQRNVTVFDPDFKAPRAWRASLGMQRRLFQFITFSADASYARGVSLYGVRDLNLSTTPAFTLSDEGNRPVYAPVSAIVPGTGVVSDVGSRQNDEFGQVFEFTSNLQSDTRQLTLGLNGATSGGSTFSVSYTLSRTMDQSSFTCCSAAQGFASPTTAGNPNLAEWAPGDQDIRNTIQALLSKAINTAVDITVNARLTSGAPFTPMVASDINGDGVRNDRAFIFDPAHTSDPTVAAAMQQLLANAPQRVRDCLESQLGQVAGRNSCRGDWTPSLDMQANMHPDGFGLHGHTTFSLVASNVLAGLDELLHKNLRGWGQPDRADPTLLYVRGFDPVTQSYLYNVNGRFGTNNFSSSIYRIPFILTLQARLAVGPDPRARFRQVFTSRMNDAVSSGSAVANPVAQIIAMRDTLQLTGAQVALLTPISDSLSARTTVIGDSIRAQMGTDNKASSNPRAFMTAIRPLIVEARQAVTDALAKVQAVLSKEQWDKVPDSVKQPAAFGMPNGRGGAGGRRRGGE